MSGLSSTWVDAIGWMLLHSLWQGAAVAIALALALLFLCRASAQAHYLAACGAMALMIALPAAAVWRPRAILSVVPAPRPIDPQPTTAEGTVATKLDSTPAPRPWRTRIVTTFPAIVGLWMTGAGVLSLRLLGGWVLAQRWVRRDTRPVVWPWINRLKERMGIRRGVAFLESAYIEVPMVIGWLRPVILVPVAALSGLTAPELEAILAHELAHIRRHDYLVNILQCVVEVLVFYHPATWWITRVIRREREHCCDDLAVAASRDRLTYARALAAMEGLRTPAFSPSPAANGGNLLARVRRILEPQEESMKPARILLSLVVVLAVAPIWLTRADDQPANADPGTAQPPLNRIEDAASVRAELKACKEFVPIAEIEAAPTGRITNPSLPFPSRSFADILTEIEAAPIGRIMIDVSTQPRAEPAGDTKVVFETVEGPNVQVGDIGFAGIRFASDARLRTQIGTRKPILNLFGTYHHETFDEARLKLIDYYQKQGFFEVKVTPVTRPTHEGKVELTFVISEGTQYRVRNVIIEGNTKIKTAVLREGMELHSGKPFLDSVRNADKNRLLAKYHEIGCIDAEVSVEPLFTSQPGVVDLVYQISEGEPYLLGELDIEGNDRSQNKVLRREAVQAGLLPSEILDRDRIDMYKRRLRTLRDLDKINDAEAEKTFTTGMYYKRIGKAASAAFYFAKILQRWPNSPWAVKAKEQQVQIEPKPIDRAAVEFFNFRIGGFY